ncbi:MAG: hypothetical protein FJZ78_09705 [Bacteroidetes bacterium]|nr:hypothetical protein [Bacteroidota bacterium]
MRILILWLLLVSILQLNAQQIVEVRNEQRHKPVFQNKYVRLLDVWIKPGDTSLYHRHALPSIFVFLTRSEIGTQILGQGKDPLSTAVGQTWFAGYENGPQVHRAWTTGTVPLHAIDIELLGKRKSNEPVRSRLMNADLRFISEHGMVRIYNLELGPFQHAQIDSNGNPAMMVCWQGDGLSIKDGKEVSLSQGKYQWWDGARSITLSNNSSDGHKVYFYEIIK